MYLTLKPAVLQLFFVLQCFTSFNYHLHAIKIKTNVSLSKKTFNMLMLMGEKKYIVKYLYF